MYWIRKWNKTFACLRKSTEPARIISGQKNTIEIAEETPLSVCSDSYLWSNKQKALPCYCVFLYWNGFGHLWWQLSVVLRAMGWDSSKMQLFMFIFYINCIKCFLILTSNLGFFQSLFWRRVLLWDSKNIPVVVLLHLW